MTFLVRKRAADKEWPIWGEWESSSFILYVISLFFCVKIILTIITDRSETVSMNKVDHWTSGYHLWLWVMFEHAVFNHMWDLGWLSEIQWLHVTRQSLAHSVAHSVNTQCYTQCSTQCDTQGWLASKGWLWCRSSSMTCILSYSYSLTKSTLGWFTFNLTLTLTLTSTLTLTLILT